MIRTSSHSWREVLKLGILLVCSLHATIVYGQTADKYGYEPKHPAGLETTVNGSQLVEKHNFGKGWFIEDLAKASKHIRKFEIVPELAAEDPLLESKKDEWPALTLKYLKNQTGARWVAVKVDRKPAKDAQRVFSIQFNENLVQAAKDLGDFPILAWQTIEYLNEGEDAAIQGKKAGHITVEAFRLGAQGIVLLLTDSVYGIRDTAGNITVQPAPPAFIKAYLDVLDQHLKKNNKKERVFLAYAPELQVDLAQPGGGKDAQRRGLHKTFLGKVDAVMPRFFWGMNTDGAEYDKRKNALYRWLKFDVGVKTKSIVPIGQTSADLDYGVYGKARLKDAAQALLAEGTNKKHLKGIGVWLFEHAVVDDLQQFRNLSATYPEPQP